MFRVLIILVLFWGFGNTVGAETVKIRLKSVRPAEAQIEESQNSLTISVVMKSFTAFDSVMNRKLSLKKAELMASAALAEYLVPDHSKAVLCRGWKVLRKEFTPDKTRFSCRVARSDVQLVAKTAEHKMKKNETAALDPGPNVRKPEPFRSILTVKGDYQDLIDEAEEILLTEMPPVVCLPEELDVFQMNAETFQEQAEIRYGVFQTEITKDLRLLRMERDELLASLDASQQKVMKRLEQKRVLMTQIRRLEEEIPKLLPQWSSDSFRHEETLDLAIIEAEEGIKRLAASLETVFADPQWELSPDEREKLSQDAKALRDRLLHRCSLGIVLSETARNFKDFEMDPEYTEAFSLVPFLAGNEEVRVVETPDAWFLLATASAFLKESDKPLAVRIRDAKLLAKTRAQANLAAEADGSHVEVSESLTEKTVESIQNGEIHVMDLSEYSQKITTSAKAILKNVRVVGWWSDGENIWILLGGKLEKNDPATEYQ